MQEFSKFNKIPGIYWVNQHLDDIKISIRLKCKDDIVNLPSFDDFKSKTHKENLNVLDSNKVEEYEFKWQEKVFSAWEIQKYSDTYNCLTETEKKYSEMITKNNFKLSKIFTYINEDNFISIPFTKMDNQTAVSNIAMCCNKVSLEEKFGTSKDISNSKGYLFKSEDNISEQEQWMSMNIVLDASQYNEDSKLLFKQEYILFSIFHNITCNYVLLSPDVNNLEFNPYNIEDSNSLVLQGSTLSQYAVEVEMYGMENTEELHELLINLYKKWEKKQKKLCNFIMPSLGKTKYFVTLEIVSGSNFEMDNIYIEYHIKIPGDISFNGHVKGQTHISKKMYIDGESQWKYGHILDLEVECATGLSPPPLKIFFEIISTDWWGRHNTQGYSCLFLTLEPGQRHICLSCSRPEELDSVEAESRRFFVGGCHLLKDLEILDNPDLKDANFRFVSSGNVLLKYHVISQSHSTSVPQETHTSASALLKGAEAVLRQYRKAKATLAAATDSIYTDTDL